MIIQSYAKNWSENVITNLGTAPLNGEQAQATLRGRPRGRLSAVGSGKGCLRGRPRGRLGPIGLGSDRFRCLGSLGSTQGAGAIV